MRRSRCGHCLTIDDIRAPQSPRLLIPRRNSSTNIGTSRKAVPWGFELTEADLPLLWEHVEQGSKLPQEINIRERLAVGRV